MISSDTKFINAIVNVTNSFFLLTWLKYVVLPVIKLVSVVRLILSLILIIPLVILVILGILIHLLIIRPLWFIIRLFIKVEVSDIYE